MTAPAGYPPVHISDEEMAVALNRLAGKSAMERAGYLMGWLAADVERHAAGLGSDPLTRQALALFRSNQYLNMVAAGQTEVTL